MRRRLAIAKNPTPLLRVGLERIVRGGGFVPNTKMAFPKASAQAKMARAQDKVVKLREVPFGQHPADKLIREIVEANRRSGRSPEQIFNDWNGHSAYKGYFLRLRYNAGVKHGKIKSLPKAKPVK